MPSRFEKSTDGYSRLGGPKRKMMKRIEREDAPPVRRVKESGADSPLAPGIARAVNNAANKYKWGAGVKKK